MLGRLRASPVSALELEMERPPPKIVKQDSLSIYEATLLKLKQGSNRSNLSVPLDDSASMDDELTMAIDIPDSFSLDSNTNSSSSSQSTCSLEQHQSSKNMSILYFFSKCKSSSQAQSLIDEEPMAGYNSSSTVSTASIDSS